MEAKNNVKSRSELETFRFDFVADINDEKKGAQNRRYKKWQMDR